MAWLIYSVNGTLVDLRPASGLRYRTAGSPEDRELCSVRGVALDCVALRSRRRALEAQRYS
jgi:hypothetical protein